MVRLLASAVFACAAAAQATFPHVVLTDLGGPGARAQLVAVDAVSGAATALPGFASDALRPLAVALDPYDGDLLVALDAGLGQSRIVRLVDLGSAFAELPIANVPGPVVQLQVAGNRLFAAVDGPGGGVYRMPRRGGAASPALAWPDLTAMQFFIPSADFAVLAWTGRPGTAQPDSGTGVYDFVGGAFTLGPFSFPNPTGRATTGVVDLPTAIPRQVLAFDDGTFALFAGLLGTPPMPIATSLPIPAGGAVAMHAAGGYSIVPFVLGGAPYPFLYSVDAFSGAVTLASAALPGAPIDFAFALDGDAHSLGLAEPCGTAMLGHSWTGAPQLGTTLTSTVVGPANSLVLLAGGLDDFAFGALPATLPGGCALDVAPEVVLAFVTTASGVANHLLPIPATPSLLGTAVFLQWVGYDPAGLSTSAAAVHWIGP